MGLAGEKLTIVDFMNKEELLRELGSKINTGEISRREVLDRFGLGSRGPEGAESSLARFSINKMLYVLGAAIVVIGVVIFVYQVWEDLGSLGRIAVTLGLGFLFTAFGSVLLKQRPEDNIGPVFHAIGGLLIPGGAMVTLSELSTGQDLAWPVAITFGVIFLFYLLLNFVHKNAILTFFAIVNGTATIYLILNAVLGGPFEGWLGVRDIYQYTTMAIGVSYLLLAYAFLSGWNNKLIGVLYFLGSAGFLGAAFSQVFDSALWQTFYPLIVIGGLFLSAYIKSRSMLIMSTLFLLAYVSYITGEYFADSLGWPISLVILGFIFIGLGYVSININRRYIAE